MAHRPDQGFVPDERVVDVAPRFSPRVGDPHVRRLNFVAGRSLTANALSLERSFWDRQTALLGRALSPGIIRGLELELLDDTPDNAAIRLTPGSGITDLGQDVTLARPLSVRLSDIPASQPLLEETIEPVGLVGLFLKPVRAVSANFFDPEDPCPVDPDAYAYNDLVTQDAVQLVWARLDRAAPVEKPSGADLSAPVRPEGGAEEDVAILGRLSSTNVRLPPRPLMGQPNPKLVRSSIYRGAVAERLIQDEENARRRGSRPAWSEHGLPIAIAQISKQGHVLFVDRFAIARSGGAVREITAGSKMGLSPALRRARFDQFLDHLQTLRAEGAALAPASQFFRKLPPTGVLPAALLDRETLSCGFFPQNYAIEAAPIQLAQMEAILAKRSMLDPFDLAKRDYVQILVPVPDHLFDPRLLIQEEISPEFAKAITRAVLRETQAKEELAELQSVEAHLTAVIDVSTASGKEHVTVSDGSDAHAMRKTATNILSDLAKSNETVPLSDEEAAETSLAKFSEAVVSIMSGGKPNSSYLGIKPVVERLAKRLDSANDHADMGFLRLQSDIFRLRKQMVGESDATRLATSPVLANLAATTTGLESSKLFADIVKHDPKPKTELRFDPALFPVMETISMPIMAGSDPVALAKMRLDNDVVKKSIASSYKPQTSFTKTFAGSFGKSITPLKIAPPTKEARSPEKMSDMGLAGIKVNLQNSIMQAGDIAWHSLIYGKGSPIRTATIAERLRPSPAQEAKNSSVATKAEIVRGIQGLGLNLDGLPLPVSASRVTLIPKSARDAEITALRAGGSAEKRAVADLLSDANAMPVDGEVYVLSDKHVLQTVLLKHPVDGEGAAANKEIYAEAEGATSRLYEHRLDLAHENLAGLILGDRLDPDPDDADEAAYFAAAVDALESAVSILRLFEGRVQSYSAFLDLARKALVQAIELSEKWQGTVDEVNAQIAEAVHDRAVATALRAEEQARLDAINAERRDILDKHVDIIAFARPMTANRLDDAPGLKLFKPLEELLPACLESNADLPDEIEEILDAMNDAPVGWYPELAAELNKLRRPVHYLTAWQRGLDRSALWLARNTDAKPRTTYSGTHRRVAGKASTGVYRALSGLIAQRRSLLETRAKRTMTSLQGVSWTGLRKAATEELSVEDLGQSGRAGRDAARKGATMLRQIGAAANCFLSGLREVPAEIRLGWADQLSEHDKAVDLATLDRIPAWPAIPLEQRRELEVMHTWLFGRIDTGNKQARAMMSTLVRVCLLLSSHAPVSSIVDGVVVEPKNVGSGDSFEVDIGIGRPQIGMIATIGDSTSFSRGIIEDIVGTRARVRVTEMRGPRIALSAQDTIKFAAPVSIQLADVRF